MKVLIFLVSFCLVLALSEAKYFPKREVQDEMPTEVQADNGTTPDAAGTKVDVAPAAEENSDDNKVTTEIPQDAPAASAAGEPPSSEANSAQSGAEQAGNSGAPSSEMPVQNVEPAAQSSSETSVSITGMVDKAEEAKPATQYSVETSSVVVIESKPVESATMKEIETPVKGAETAANEAETQSKETETPTKEAETSAKEPETPAKEPETPAKEPETPAKETETPAKEPETPAKEPETPAKAVETPTKKEPEQQPTNTNSTDTASAISEPVAAGSTKKNGNNSVAGFVASMVLVALCLCLTANQ